MAPRFVELSRPVEESVAWASTLPSALGDRVSNIAHDSLNTLANVTHDTMKSMPTLKAFEDLKGLVASMVLIMPEPRYEVKLLGALSVAALLLRYAFLYLYSSSIVRHFGASNIVLKDD